jgi:adenylate cyclase
MAIEIERKFLVADASCLDGVEGVRIAQGYLSPDPDRTVRVRLAGDKAWITVKGRTEGHTRAEFEFPIPADDATGLLDMCAQPVIDKTRHRVAVGDHVWEVDVFHGENEGLVLAEVELRDESDRPVLPPWIGREVSDDPRFFNANLATMSFRSFSGDL